MPAQPAAPPPNHLPPNPLRNVMLLTLCQALFLSGNSIFATISSLAGQLLADNPALATLPITTGIIGTALATIPATLIMRAIGRRYGFMLGALLSVLGAVGAVVATRQGSFELLLIAALFSGSYMAFGQLYRFAAAEVAPTFRARAISWTLAGGVVAAFIGPEVAKVAVVEGAENPYASAYMAMAAFPALTLVVLLFLRLPPMGGSEAGGRERPLWHIVRQPVYLVAVLCGMISYAVMNLLMTGTPLAMIGSGHPFSNAATVIQWHIVGMFLPSFITGSLISRYGGLPVMLVGAVLDLVALGIGLQGTAMWHFWGALVAVGVGWNFLFIGATTILTTTYDPREATGAQALNEFLVFGTMALSSISSGALLHYMGWNMILYTAFPLVLLAMLAVGVLLYFRGVMRVG